MIFFFLVPALVYRFKCSWESGKFMWQLIKFICLLFITDYTGRTSVGLGV